MSANLWGLGSGDSKSATSPFDYKPRPGEDGQKILGKKKAKPWLSAAALGPLHILG